MAFAISNMGSTKTLNIDGVTFHAVLTQSEPVQGSSTHYTLQSTLSTTASTTTNGTVIECIDPFTEASDSSTLQLQGQYHPMILISSCSLDLYCFLSLSLNKFYLLNQPIYITVSLPMALVK